MIFDPSWNKNTLQAKTYANYRQRRYRRWKLQVCFTKFGTITKERNGSKKRRKKIRRSPCSISGGARAQFPADFTAQPQSM